MEGKSKSREGGRKEGKNKQNNSAGSRGNINPVKCLNHVVWSHQVVGTVVRIREFPRTHNPLDQDLSAPRRPPWMTSPAIPSPRRETRNSGASPPAGLTVGSGSRDDANARANGPRWGRLPSACCSRPASRLILNLLRGGSRFPRRGRICRTGGNATHNHNSGTHKSHLGFKTESPKYSPRFQL